MRPNQVHSRESEAFSRCPVCNTLYAGKFCPQGCQKMCIRDRYCVELAAAVSCLKHTVPGDAHILSRAEAEGLIESDTIMPRR